MLWLDTFVMCVCCDYACVFGFDTLVVGDVAAGCLRGVVMWVCCLLVLWFVWGVCFVILVGLCCLVTLRG